METDLFNFMPLTREQKQKIIEELKEKIGRQKAMVLVDFAGLKVEEFSRLRKKLKEVKAELKVAKKTLMDIAFKNAEVELEIKKLPGQVALIFAFEDEILPAKLIWQFSKDYPNLKILGGFFEEQFKDVKEVIAISQLPGKKELLARLISSIEAPIFNFVNILEANIKGLIYTLSAIKK